MWKAVLAQLLPLLARRASAAERQAAALEQLAYWAEQLVKLDPVWQAAQQPALSEEEEVAATDAEVQSPAERQLAAEQLETFKALWWQQHGEVLSDEDAVVRYEAAYQQALGRLRPAPEDRLPGRRH